MRCSAARLVSQHILQVCSASSGQGKRSPALPQALQRGSAHSRTPTPAPHPGGVPALLHPSPLLQGPEQHAMGESVPARAPSPRSHPRAGTQITGSTGAPLPTFGITPSQLHPAQPCSKALRSDFLTMFPASFFPPLTSKSGFFSLFPPCVRRGVSSLPSDVNH